MYEAYHVKTRFKIFVIVIPKEGSAGTSPDKPYFVRTPTINGNQTSFIPEEHLA